MLHVGLLRSGVVDMFKEYICGFDSLCVLELIVERVSHAVQFLVHIDQRKILLYFLLDERYTA